MLPGYCASGLAALVRRARSDKGSRPMPCELQMLIEGLALRRPPPAITTVHRRAAEVAREQGWPVPGYAGTTGKVSVCCSPAGRARHTIRAIRVPYQRAKGARLP